MNTVWRLVLSCLLLCAATRVAEGQDRLSANTLTLAAEAARPPAGLADLAWLEGHWRGGGPGGVSEEIWSPALAGTMMGMFRQVRADSVVFYELMTVVEEEGSLGLHLKHFGPDLTGWEERGEVQSFPLVKATPGAMYFDGLTYEMRGADSLRVYVVVSQQGGTAREAVFNFGRVQ